MRQARFLLPVLLLGMAAGAALDRYWLAAGDAASTGLDRLDGQQTLYVCPMHPDVVRNAPGNCPVCGMELEPVSGHEHAPVPGSGQAGRPMVSISPVVANNLGVRTARVEKTRLWRKMKTAGYVKGYQRGRRLQVRSPVAGTVARLHVAVGARVKKGDVLAEISSPERREAQQRHLELLAEGDSRAIAESRRRLRRLALRQADIEALEQGGTPVGHLLIEAPHDGRVVAVANGEGSAVTPASVVLVVEEQGVLNVEVDVFRNQVAWVKPGDRAELQLANRPGKVWQGRVSAQGVDLRPRSRTYALRAAFPMEEGVALPDMYADVTLFGAPVDAALAVPRQALIRTGSGARVVRVLGGGRFQPVDVVPGIESGDRVQIVSGLREGDEIVVSAQFLIDSESNLQAGFQRMDAGTAQQQP